MRAAPDEGPICLTYSVETAARLLGISRALAYQLVRAGDIPSVKLGRRVLIPRQAVAGLVGAPTADDPERQAS